MSTTSESQARRVTRAESALRNHEQNLHLEPSDAGFKTDAPASHRRWFSLTALSSSGRQSGTDHLQTSQCYSAQQRHPESSLDVLCECVFTCGADGLTPKCVGGCGEEMKSSTFFVVQGCRPMLCAVNLKGCKSGRPKVKEEIADDPCQRNIGFERSEETKHWPSRLEWS